MTDPEAWVDCVRCFGPMARVDENRLKGLCRDCWDAKEAWLEARLPLESR